MNNLITALKPKRLFRMNNLIRAYLFTYFVLGYCICEPDYKGIINDFLWACFKTQI